MATNNATNNGFEKVTVYDTPGSYTWTKDSRTRFITVIAWHGGGGGGSGARSDFSTKDASGGSGGGAGGGFYKTNLPAYFFGSSETVTVGAGGTGGAALADIGTYSAGNAGTDGGRTSFGALTSTVLSTGGAGGADTDRAVTTSGPIILPTWTAYSVTGSSNTNPGGLGGPNGYSGAGLIGTGGTAVLCSRWTKEAYSAYMYYFHEVVLATAGGGGGGWNQSTTTASNGGAGAAIVDMTLYPYQSGTTTLLYAGTGAIVSTSVSTAGSDYIRSGRIIGGTGGGGGAGSNSLFTWSDGSDGGFPGGGGGGGGGGKSGKGGNGGNGCIIIIEN